MSENIIQETIKLLSGDLEIAHEYFPVVVEETEAWAQLRKLVAEKILYLMENDVEQLKYILYRLDVNERKVKKVLSESPFGEAADGIAELVLTREIEKARTRQQFSSGAGNWLDV